MILHAPLCISARLMPAIRINDAWLSLAEDGVTFYLDLPSGYEHKITEYRPGCGVTKLEARFEDMLVFLADTPHNFPRKVQAWAKKNHDELSILQCVLSEVELCTPQKRHFTATWNATAKNQSHTLTPRASCIVKPTGSTDVKAVSDVGK